MIRYLGACLPGSTPLGRDIAAPGRLRIYTLLHHCRPCRSAKKVSTVLPMRSERIARSILPRPWALNWFLDSHDIERFRAFELVPAPDDLVEIAPRDHTGALFELF